MEPIIQQTLAKGAATMDDVGWIKWAFGAAGTAIAAAYGHLRVRLDRADDHNDAKRTEIWDAMEKMRDKHDGLERNMLRDMATKTDLASLKTDLIAAINQRRDVWPEERRRDLRGE